VRASLLALLVASCGTPDRWNASATYGQSSYDGFENGDRDGVSGAVEVGVSGPLFQRTTPPPRMPADYDPHAQPSPVAPTESPIPWEELLLLLSGAATLKGSQVGVEAYKKRRSSRS
jgi:hypothetical protein